MDLSLYGIENRGDFFAPHFFEALLEGELSELLKRFRALESEKGIRPPWKALLGLAEKAYRLRAEAAGVVDARPRLEAARELHALVLEALGYERRPSVVALEDGSLVPVALALSQGSAPHLWVLEAPFPKSEDESAPLEHVPHALQLPAELEGTEEAARLTTLTLVDLFDGPLLRMEGAARYVLLLAGMEILLIDRDKWPQGRALAFDLSVPYDKKDQKAAEAFVGLLHREAIAPEGGGTALIDRLDEASHKKAFAVTTDLGRGVREAIEILASEALYYRRTVQKRGVFDDAELAADLTRECIVYLYRLLFLLYVEARDKELGVVPMNAEAYREGYSIEALRDLELTQLTTPEAQGGYFLDASLRKLFEIVQHGYPRKKQLTLAAEGALQAGFIVEPLRSQLFDDEILRILPKVRLRNFAVQQVLERLSLSKGGKEGRSRISYAQLGINQLGAVYERLLSYRGFFATEDVVELMSAGSSQSEETQTYFLAASRKDEVDEKLLIKDEAGRPIVHPKGTFLYRMAGRDREKSASYYTPEVLTRCLVKYTLLERLGLPFGRNDERPAERRLPRLSADEILDLTLCEPAMGSGAFLVEAIDQLAEHYLRAKQDELGKRVPAERYAEEKQRVKHHFAANRAYGVDLNPLAAELGKVSLWLASLHEGAKAPFLDLRIRPGNSLIGARRAVFQAADLARKDSKKGRRNYLGLTPEKLPFAAKRSKGAVYHFLVGEEGMAAAAEEKNLKGLSPEAAKAMREWRKRFLASYDEVELRRLEAVSARVDALFAAHLEARRTLLKRTARRVPLWGQPAPEGLGAPDDAQTLAEEAKRHEGDHLPGGRLRLLMDYFCALFFWPLDEAERLPTRGDWVQDLEALTDPGSNVEGFVEGWSKGAPARIAVVKRLAERYRFFHWEVEFPEAFAERGGMDVILGNPPWRKVEWKEGDVLADFEPTLAVKKLSAKQWDDEKAALLEDAAARGTYHAEAEEAAGTQAFLGSVQAYPLLQGVQSNLYKAFMTRALDLGGEAGSIGMIHQKGLFDDPKGGGVTRGAHFAPLAPASLHQQAPLVLRD